MEDARRINFRNVRQIGGGCAHGLVESLCLILGETTGQDNHNDYLL